MKAADGLPVYLKAPGDMRIFKSFMGFCGGGMVIAFGCIYLIATGQMPKKERPS